MTKAYLRGVLHDSTERKTTYRVASKSHKFCQYLVKGIKNLGFGAWIYKEGKERSVWIVEFSKPVLKNFQIKSAQDKIDYIRGYFDTEGGISRSPQVRYYLYFCQKNLADLKKVRQYLEDLGISCGVIHNPSRRVDPNYWRFFIRANSYLKFATLIGSYHPDKASYLRMKI